MLKKFIYLSHGFFSAFGLQKDFSPIYALTNAERARPRLLDGYL
jgi:hypothetical protein